jgi:drug/metabolite transporter (DMT)-like permease
VSPAAEQAFPQPGAQARTRFRTEHTAALAAALVTVVFWASAFVGIRSAGRSLSPGALSLGRLLVGAVALALLLLARNERLPSWSELRPVAPPLLACGLLWFGAYNVALNAAERRVDAGTAAMLVNVGPILIAILAGFLLHEGFPRTLLLGCAIAFGGVIAIGFATSSAGVTTAGVVLCLLAAVAYAGGVVAQKRVLSTLSPLQTILLCCLIGAVACLPFAPQLVGELGDADAPAIGWMVYLGVFPTALAFTTWAFALARTGAGRMAATTYLVPPVSILLGWLLLSESPPALALVGGAVCLAGVIVARR